MKDGFLRVAAATPSIRPADVAGNVDAVLELVRQAPEDTALLVFPELCLTGYTCSDLFLQPALLKAAEEGLRRLLDAGVQCGVVSNKQDDLARAIVEHHFPGVFARVRGAVAGCPVKPAPDGVQALMAAMGADPARTLYVGDSNVDIYTAHNAKLPGCGAVWGFRGRDELLAAGADVLADTPEDLANVVLG